MRSVSISLLTVIISVNVFFGVLVPATRGSTITSFGSNVRVNNDVYSGDQVEPSIADNPTNTNNLIAAYIGDPSETPAQPCDTYVSSDLATSWGSRVRHDSNCSDPVVRFAADGTAYLSYLEVIGLNIKLEKSTEDPTTRVSGTSWTSLPTVTSPLSNNCLIHSLDKPWLAIDSTNNIVYIAYWAYDYSGTYCTTLTYRVTLAWSQTTDLQHWTQVNVTTSTGTTSTATEVAFPSVIVAPNGNVNIAWVNLINNAQFQIQAEVLGPKPTSPSKVITVDTENQVAPSTTKLPGLNWKVVGTIDPKIAAGPNPNSQATYNVYLVYGTAGSGTDPADIYFAVSNDGGNKWSHQKLNNDVTFAAQFFPSIAVHDGTSLHVTYADMSSNGAILPTGQYNIVHRGSNDGGLTWSSTLTVTDKVSNANSSYATDYNALGDYFDIAIAGEDVIPIWTDWRNPAYGADIYTGFGQPSSPGGSVMAGTQILMSNGSWLAVENTAVGMGIRSFDPIAYRFYDATITGLVTKSVNNLYIIGTSSGNPIRVDYFEQFWVQKPSGQQQWTLAGRLQLGYKILRPVDGVWANVTFINIATGNFTVYDLIITPTLPGGPMPVIANGYLDMKCGPGGC